MAIDNRLIPLSSLNQYFVDKDTGEALAGGKLYFFANSDQSTPKAVYELVNNSGVYSYQALPNPITLSASGTAQDALGNNVLIYGFPYEDTPDEDSTTLDIYYVVCQDSGGGIQWTREAIPTITDANADPVNDDFNKTNALSNSQFSQYFLNDGSNAITVASATNQEVSIAPDWTLVISGSGTVTVTRTAVSGSNQLPYLPAYYLTVAVGAGITNCLLRQRLNNNSGLWGNATANTNNGIITSTASIKGDADGRVVTMYYKDNSETAFPINAITATTSWASYSDKKLITTDLSSTSSATGFVDIYFVLPVGTIDITNVQVVPVPGATNIDSVVEPPYEQRSSNRELAFMADYYLPSIFKWSNKNILTAWDFEKNPAQLGTSGTISDDSAAGTPLGEYIWDQTISGRAGSDVTYARSTLTNGLQLTSTGATSSVTLIQYLEPGEIKEYIGQDLSVNVVAHKTSVGTATGRVYLATAPSSSSIPTLTTILGQVNAGGVLSLTAAGWVLVPRQDKPTPQFTVNQADTVTLLNSATTDFGFNGWKLEPTTDMNFTPHHFAIIVTFEMPTTATVLTVDSINLSRGTIPARPAPETYEEVLGNCQRYYEKSYEQDTAAGSAVGTTNSSVNAVRFPVPSLMRQNGASLEGYYQRCSWGVDYKVTKRTSPTVSIYSPGGTLDRMIIVSSTGGAVTDRSNETVSTDYNVRDAGTKRIHYRPVSTGADGVYTPGAVASFRAYEGVFHYVADARLGKV